MRLQLPQVQRQRQNRLDHWLPWLPYLALIALLWYKERTILRLMPIAPGPNFRLGALGALVALTPWPRLTRGRLQGALFTLLNVIVTLLLYADLLYYRQFQDLTSVANLRYLAQLGDVGGSVTALLGPQDLWLFFDLPLWALLTALPSRWVSRLFARPRLPWLVVPLTAALGVALVFQAAARDPLLSQQYYGHTMVGSRLGLLNYHASDLASYGRRLWGRALPPPERVAQVKAFLAERPTEPSPFTGVAKGKNLIVIQFESLQTFALGLTIEGQEITPNLNRLRAESLYFSNFFEQTGQGVTSDADLLGNCSLYPAAAGAAYFEYATNDFRCLPELLAQRGYTTVAMQGMEPSFWNLGTVYPAIGFGRFESSLNYDLDELIGIGLSDGSFFRQSVEKLKALPEPYEAFLVTLTSHGPFAFAGLPTPLQLGELTGTYLADYLQAIHYADQALGQFLDALKSEGLLDRAVLALYGDHRGIHRGESGLAQLFNLPPEGAPLQWQRLERQVPFLIRLPNGQGAGEYPEPAGQIDIAPTLADLLGLATHEHLFLGRNLLAPTAEAPSLSFHRGSATDGRVFHHSFDGSFANSACYDFETGETLEKEKCRPVYEAARKRRQIGQWLLDYNLVPSLLPPA